MEDEIKKKRFYIYENIDKIKNHDQIIDLIQLKECKYTKNNNGIFLNLSVLDEEIINMIYQIIINSLDYEEKNENYIIEPLYIEKKEEVVKGNDQKNTKKKLLLKNFKKKNKRLFITQKDIIYKFDSI